MSLRNDLESRMVTLGRRAENARVLLLHLYQQPIVTSKQVAELLDVTPRAANGLIEQFVLLDILEETTGFQRNRMYVFRKYLHMFG